MDAPAELGGNKKKITSIQKPPITVGTDHEIAAVDRSSQQQAARSNTSVHSEANLSMDHLMIIKSSLTGES